jgi:hypothetical protein
LKVSSRIEELGMKKPRGHDFARKGTIPIFNGMRVDAAVTGLANARFKRDPRPRLAG